MLQARPERRGCGRARWPEKAGGDNNITFEGELDKVGGVGIANVRQT